MEVYMFHYVKDTFKYPHFDLNDFEKVIAKMCSEYRILGLEEYYRLMNNHNNENDKCVLLTFDDGTKDHYECVFPILKKYNIKATFFLCSNIFKKEILDIHFIHQLLSKSSIDELYDELTNILLKYKYVIDDLPTIKVEYDDNKTAKFKQLLQYILPKSIRKSVLNELIRIHNISTKYEDYYISLEEIQEMKKNGMDFGLHTENHHRLGTLNYNDQYNEIKNNYDTFIEKKLFSEVKSISYPFNSYDDNTIDIVEKLDIDLGFAIDILENKKNNKYLITRKDCNVLKEWLK